ncbi:MAG: hypothetical protein WB760_11055 [Xanthobacteraceae bacterium]
MSDIPLPPRMSDIPLPPSRAARVRKTVEECEQSPAVAATQKPRLAYERREGVFPLLLPAASVLFGGSLLLGLLKYVDHAPTPHEEPMLSLVIGLVLTGLGGLELLRRGFRRRGDQYRG